MDATAPIPPEETADVGALADVDPDTIVEGLNRSIARAMPSYGDLYRRWERLTWRVSDLDFTQDRRDWNALDAAYRERLLWLLAAFYVGEQRVAATLAPYVRAAPAIEQKIFLATQCVDEVRHAVFFDRWFEEVVGERGAMADRLDSARRRTGPGFAPLFDDYLDSVTQTLVARPDDVRAYARAVAVYHLVIEGVLALTGQRFILAWARTRGILPGFRAGFTAVARDESRHVAFGAKVIHDLVKADPSLLDTVHDGLRETLRLATWLYQPPGGDVAYTSAFGYSLGDLFRHGSIQLEKKLRAMGLPMPRVDIWVPEIDARWPPPRGGVVPTDLRQRVTTALTRALGRVAPALAPGIAVMLLHLAFSPRAARDADVVYEFELRGGGGGTFTVALRNGRCDISLGRTAHPPDVVYTMDASTWLAMVQGRVTGDEALLLGKLRVRGDPVAARRFGEFFSSQGEPAVAAAGRTGAIRPARANGPGGGGAVCRDGRSPQSRRPAAGGDG